MGGGIGVEALNGGAVLGVTVPVINFRLSGLNRTRKLPSYPLSVDLKMKLSHTLY